MTIAGGTTRHAAGWPAGVVPAAAFGGLLVAAAFATSTRGLFDGVVRAVPIVVVVAAAAAASAWPGALGIGVLGWAFCDGFVVDRYGELDWHALADVWRLAAFVGLAAVASAVGRRASRRRPAAGDGDSVDRKASSGDTHRFGGAGG